MKTRFNTYDIICMVTELQRLIGMRVNQVYDIDNKSYLIRLQRSEEKAVLLLESANRFHTTQFEWPKNVAPSGFTMKLRKHLKNKRLEKLTQLGVDRVVDLQFGSGEAAYHVILELYDRGNIVLTDCEWTILNVLRPHVEGDKVRFAVKEKYPLDRAKASSEPPDRAALEQILAKSKPGDNLKKILNPNLEYGPSIIDHVLQECGLSGTMKVSADPDKGFQVERDLDRLLAALQAAEALMQTAKTEIAKGYIIQKKEPRPVPEGGGSDFLLTNQEFHPMLYSQHKTQPYAEYDTFDRAVDEFFSALEGQKIDLKTIQVEREAMKKLQNVRKDHEKRVTELEQVQVTDKQSAELISRNEPLVEQARMAVQNAIANQMSWDDIKLLVKTAQENDDPVASCIKQLKLATNHMTLLLSDPYEEINEARPVCVDIDLGLTAFANARRYYDQKRNAFKKQQKTLESADKALRSAERRTRQTLREVQAISTISKARKTYWFEKFFWFISSDNYLVIGGRDQQQNEVVVKRHLRAGDVYVHADVAGAASLVVKNPRAAPVPPRTLAEAGQAAVAYSVAWEARVLRGAWWVWAAQVSKAAPSGEYLSTGSFMIRGKKNYLLPHHLQLGFGFMFRLEDSSIERHRDERKPIALDDGPVTSDAPPTTTTTTTDVTSSATTATSDAATTSTDQVPGDEPEDAEQDEEIPVSEDESEDQSPDEDDPLKYVQDKRWNEHNNRLAAIEQMKRGIQPSIDDIIEEPDSDAEAFPDTHIKVDHGTGQVIIESKVRTTSEMSDRSDDKLPTFPALPKKQNQKSGKKPNQKEKEVKEEKPKEQSIKRGQRSKLKKIKEKYKDQDEEERALKMELLQSANTAKDTKKAQKKALAAGAGGRQGKTRGAKIPQPAPLILEAEDDEPDLDNEPEQQSAAETEMLSQLTGCPLPEDELLFAVPVVAPYSALHNYKYKVKLTPGTGKRGKAAKTAVQVFIRERGCTPRERDLLKAVKEEDVARNFPGKVKLSAPQLHKHKK